MNLKNHKIFLQDILHITEQLKNLYINLYL